MKMCPYSDYNVNSKAKEISLMTNCPYCGKEVLGDEKGKLCDACGVSWGADGTIQASIERPRRGGWNSFPEGALLVRREQVEA
jgi:hypothetical protein